MRKLVFVVLVLVAAGCSKKAEHEKACNHMIDLAVKDIDENIEKVKSSEVGADMAKSLEDMKDKAVAKRDSDLATCVSKIGEHDINTDCILKADKLDDLQSCGLIF